MRWQSHLPGHVSSPTPQGNQSHLSSPLPMENSCFSRPRCSMPSLSFFSPLILKLDANKRNSRVALHQTNPIASHYCHSDHSTPHLKGTSSTKQEAVIPLHPSSPNACDLHRSILICLQVWPILDSGNPKIRLILNLLLHLSRLEYSDLFAGFHL